MLQDMGNWAIPQVSFENIKGGMRNYVQKR